MRLFKRKKKWETRLTTLPLLVSHVWTAWATRGQMDSVHVWLTWLTRGHHAMAFWPFLPHTHPTRSSTVFGPPNSDFESVFRLRIVTPIHTTTTKKLCKNVEKSSRKITSKTTQRMRMQISIATSFGL